MIVSGYTIEFDIYSSKATIMSTNETVNELVVKISQSLTTLSDIDQFKEQVRKMLTENEKRLSHLEALFSFLENSDVKELDRQEVKHWVDLKDHDATRMIVWTEFQRNLLGEDVVVEYTPDIAEAKGNISSKQFEKSILVKQVERLKRIQNAIKQEAENIQPLKTLAMLKMLEGKNPTDFLQNVLDEHARRKAADAAVERQKIQKRKREI